MLSIVEAAGWPIWPLILCSITALGVVLERLSSLRTPRVIPPRLLDEALAVSATALPPADTVDKLERNSPLGAVLAAGFRAKPWDAPMLAMPCPMPHSPDAMAIAKPDVITTHVAVELPAAAAPPA